MNAPTPQDASEMAKRSDEVRAYVLVLEEVVGSIKSDSPLSDVMGHPMGGGTFSEKLERASRCLARLIVANQELQPVLRRVLGK